MSDQAEKQKLKEASPDARVEQKAARAGSDQAQAEMPEHQRQAQVKKSQFEQAGLSSSPRTHVSETFGRLQMEDKGQVLVKGVEPGAKRAEHVREARPEAAAGSVLDQREDIIESTAHIQKLVAKKPGDRELKNLADNYQVVNRMDEGPVKDNLKETIVSAARKHSPEIDQLYQRREGSAKSPAELLAEHQASYNPDSPDHAGDSLPAITSEQAVSYRVGERADGGMLIESGISQKSYQNEWQAFTRLPPDYQQKVIEIFQNGSQVGQQSIHETADDILQKTAKGYIDVVKVPLDIAVMAGRGLLGVLEFERDLLVNPERAQQNAAVAGEHIGKALVAGVKLWAGLSGYASDVQQSGDYRRPFQDLGNALNKWYDGLTPGDQMGIMGNISAGFGIGAAAGQLKNLAKPGAFAQFLEEAASAVPKNPEAQAKAAETIRKLIEGMTSKPGGMQPALAGEAGVLGPGESLMNQIESTAKALNDRFEQLLNKMTAHKPEGGKGKWDAAKEAHDTSMPTLRSLNNIQTRDWYNARVAEIDDFELQMREAGKSAKEIFEKVHELRNRAKQQARDLMKDRFAAEELERKYPLKTREEILARYGGDYEKAIDASKRTNTDVNNRIEEMRKKGQTEE